MLTELKDSSLRYRMEVIVN